MNIRDISKPVTAQALNESLARHFGERLKLESFTLEQLYDVRNKIRTKLSQVETNESYDNVQKNGSYQKNRLFLDVLNAEILERENIEEGDYANDTQRKAIHASKDEKKKKKKMKEADTPNLDRNLKNIDKSYGADDDSGIGPRTTGFSPNAEIRKILAKAIYSAMKAAGVNVEPNKVKQAARNAAKTMSESNQNQTRETRIIENYFSHARKLFEGEEDKAELVMASKDMVDRVTGWMEDTAEMQTESMLELADAIRDEMGNSESEEFVNTVKPALEQLYAAMETTRASLTQGVGMLTGEFESAQDMGAEEEEPIEPEAEMEPTVDQEDDFAAAEPAAGGEAEAGRERRESVERSRRLGTILSSKKK